MSQHWTRDVAAAAAAAAEEDQHDTKSAHI